MPTTTWNLTTIDGAEYLVIDVAQFRIPLDWDPSSNMFIAVAAPIGGLGSFPALVQGDTGPAPTLDPVVNYTVLGPTDPTPNSASFTPTSPGVYQLNLVIHEGPEGTPGDTILDPDDFTGTQLPGKMLVLNAGTTAFEYQSQKVGDRYVPAAIANTPSGNPTYTLCSVSIPAQPFDWRPQVSGHCLLNGTSSNVRVDLIARLDAGLGGTPEISGNIVGRGIGVASTFIQAIVISAGPPTNASATYDKVAAGTAAVVYLRAERQAGTGTFTTTATDTHFCVRVEPIPL